MRLEGEGWGQGEGLLIGRGFRATLSPAGRENGVSGRTAMNKREWKMIGRIRRLEGAALLLGGIVGMVSQCLALEVSGESPRPESFAVASARFEQNATDGDVEVVFEVEGSDDGLTKLAVVSPDGRTIIDFTAPDVSTLGTRGFRFESPEPRDTESLKSAYPEGTYIFTGTSAAGVKFHAESTLSHKLPVAISFLRPPAGERGVDTKDLRITWTPVQNVAGYIIDIEQDELDVSITAKLPGSVTSFPVPDGFLVPGTQYELAIGAVTYEGNRSFVETVFTTAGKK
jgi:hypothetical protein